MLEEELVYTYAIRSACIYGVIPESVSQFTGKKDINGKEIYYDTDRCKFKLWDSASGKWLELECIFTWNDEEMRTELDVFGSSMITCLWYDYQNMKDFEIIEEKK
jgi:hypothetical protein